MYDEYINASKGKVPVKGKGKQGDGKGGKSKWRAACEAVAHKDIIVPSIIHEDSQVDVQSAAPLAIMLLNALVQ